MCRKNYTFFTQHQLNVVKQNELYVVQFSLEAHSKALKKFDLDFHAFFV